MNKHVTSDLTEYALGLLEDSRTKDIAEHLRHCKTCLVSHFDIINSLSESVSIKEMAPASILKDKLLQEVKKRAPYSAYKKEISSMTGVSEDKVIEIFSSMPRTSTWVDGPIPRCRLYPWPEHSSREVIKTLVLMESGSHFPNHEHLGRELVFILQGHFRDSNGKLYSPGEIIEKTAGSSHDFDVCDGLDLVYLAVVDEGIRIGEQVLTAASLAK